MGKEVQQQIALNLLSEGTQITGDLHASNDIRIDGELKGKISRKDVWSSGRWPRWRERLILRMLIF